MKQMPTDAIHLNVSPDGQPTGDAVIMFANRSEAERVVAERGRKPLAQSVMNNGAGNNGINKNVEMYVAQVS